jgi:hypothetical protein
MEELIGDCTNLHISYPTLVLGYLHLLRANRKLGEVVDLIEGDDGTAESDTEVEEVDFARADDTADLVGELPESTAEEPKRKALTKNDMAFDDSGAVSPEIRRFGIAVSRLAGRAGIRDDLTRYESIGLALVEAEAGNAGNLVDGYPEASSGLDVAGFFERLYQQYDERFVYGAPSLASVTRRVGWAPESTALDVGADYEPRLGEPRMPKPRAPKLV